MSTFKFEVVNDLHGGGLKGWMTITYQELVSVLGKGRQGCDKSVEEWYIVGEINGEKVFATIYDYKSYPEEYGWFGSAESITDWHIGGDDKRAVELVKLLFPNNDTIRPIPEDYGWHFFV